jgi:hypothetical protein
LLRSGRMGPGAGGGGSGDGGDGGGSDGGGSDGGGGGGGGGSAADAAVGKGSQSSSSSRTATVDRLRPVSESRTYEGFRFPRSAMGRVGDVRFNGLPKGLCELHTQRNPECVSHV